VTDASLATMRLATSRGEATVPAWRFTVAELVVPVLHAAVAPSAITAPPQPRIAADSDLSALDGVTGDGPAAAVRRLTVHYTTGACIETNRVLIHETAGAVVLGADVVASGGICDDLAKHQKSAVDLAAPLGDRVLLDARTGAAVVYGTCGQWMIMGC
jgi:hypothetical protein